MPTTTYIRDDEHGVKRVGTSRVMLDSVIAATANRRTASAAPRHIPAAVLFLLPLE
ncbi:MAG: hypothetical protein ACODAD_07070 [Planctomycetota bacterium]